MKRLLLWVLILTIFLSGGIALAGQAGIGAPKPAFAQWFTYPDGKPCPMPCLFGIQPGVTNLDETEAILRVHPLTKPSEGVNENEGENYEWYISVQTQNDVSHTDDKTIIRACVCGFAYRKVPGTFGDLLFLLGIPSRVSLSRYNAWDVNVFYYDAQSAYILVSSREDACIFSLNASVSEIHIFSPAHYREMLIETADDMKPYQWAGFSRHSYWERYFALLGAEEYSCSP
jgi:hypothetical protein